MTEVNNIRIFNALDHLDARIATEDITAIAAGTRPWGGADVIIARRMTRNLKEWLGDADFVISFQESVPIRRLVITEHYRELSWLFEQMRAIYSGRIDYLSKYDFYGLLAQAASDYLKSQNDLCDLRQMLLAVSKASRTYLN